MKKGKNLEKELVLTKYGKSLNKQILMEYLLLVTIFCLIFIFYTQLLSKN